MPITEKQVIRWREERQRQIGHIEDLMDDLAAGQEDEDVVGTIHHTVEHAKGLVAKYEAMIAAGEKRIADRT